MLAVNIWLAKVCLRLWTVTESPHWCRSWTRRLCRQCGIEPHVVQWIGEQDTGLGGVKEIESPPWGRTTGDNQSSHWDFPVLSRARESILCRAKRIAFPQLRRATYLMISAPEKIRTLSHLFRSLNCSCSLHCAFCLKRMWWLLV